MLTSSILDDFFPSRAQGPLRETLLGRDDKRGEPIFSTILRQGLSLEDPAGFTLDDNLNYRDRLRESRVLFERPCWGVMIKEVNRFSLQFFGRVSR
jgi:hypothetical protein